MECVESAVTRVHDGEILWRRRGGRLYVCECKTSDMENSYWKKGVCKAWRSFVHSFVHRVVFFPRFSRSFLPRLVVQFSLCVFSLCANTHTHTHGRSVCLLSFQFTFEELIRVYHTEQCGDILRFFFYPLPFVRLLLSVDESINTAFIPFIQ